MFFGTDDFSVVSLNGLLKCLEEKKIGTLEVVTLNEKCPVADLALSNNLKLHRWPPPLSKPFDLGVVVSFGKLIPKAIIDHFPLGIINVHASLLPLYRGANPIFHAIKNGDLMTGITIMKIKPFKFDVGDIIMQETCEIDQDELMPYLRSKLALLGAKCLVTTIGGLPHSLDKWVPQSSDKASLAPKIKKDVAQVHWNKITAAGVYNLHRGLFGLYKLKTALNTVSIKLICISPEFIGKSELFSQSNSLPPGTLEYCHKTRTLRVHCTDKPLYICTLQVGNKLHTALTFYSGYLHSLPKEQWILK